MVAARADSRGAVLVCAIGTALTVDLVDAAGCHRGGRIAPSPTLMREALQARIVQLPASGGSYR
jgi:type III pantothenate kinase